MNPEVKQMYNINLQQELLVYQRQRHVREYVSHYLTYVDNQDKIRKHLMYLHKEYAHEPGTVDAILEALQYKSPENYEWFKKMLLLTP